MGGQAVNAFAAVAIIIAAFFIAGLMVGFLIVMALSAPAAAATADRGSRRVNGGQEPRAGRVGRSGRSHAVARRRTVRGDLRQGARP